MKDYKKERMNSKYNLEKMEKPNSSFTELDKGKKLKHKYKELEQEELPQWQEEILNNRLEMLANHPTDVTNLDDFIKEIGFYTQRNSIIKEERNKHLNGEGNLYNWEEVKEMAQNREMRLVK